MTDRSLGAAHSDPRHAYRDVPVLKQPTWNHEVAAYFFFGGVSAGAAVVGSVAEVAGGDRHRRLARVAHYVSLATFAPCPPLLIDDLGVPRKFHHMLRVFKPQSPMNLGSWALLLHGVGATVTVGRMLAEEGKLPLVGWLARLIPEGLLAGLGIPSSLLLAGYTGVLLGTTSVPAWHTSHLLGALFMSSSFGSGLAAISLAAETISSITHDEKERLAALAAAAGATESALLLGYVATSGEGTKHLTRGLAGKLMAGAAACIALSTLVEAASVARRKHIRGASLLAGVAGLAGGALLRWGVIKAGQASAADREASLRAMQPREGSPGWRGPAR